jgi:hypothetical protein
MKYEADGERWDVYLSEERAHDGVRSLIFHCESNSSHGWRVAEVPADRFTSQDSLDRLDESDLAELYARSQPFDYVHDPAAREDSVADPRGR